MFVTADVGSLRCDQIVGYMQMCMHSEYILDNAGEMVIYSVINKGDGGESIKSRRRLVNNAKASV